MFKKLFAIVLVAGISTAGFVATSPTARSSELEEGPCVIAVLKDDPSFRAQRGDCSGVEDTAPVEVTGQNQSVFVGALNIRDFSLADTNVRMKLVNQLTGKVIVDESKTLPWDGGSEFRFFDSVTQPASASLPSYLLTLTIGDKTYTKAYGTSSFVKQGTDGDLTTYVAEVYSHYKNGAIADGYM